MQFDWLKRRDFVTFLGGAAAVWSLPARSQQSPRMRRIGVLISVARSDPEGRRAVQALLQGLQELGWRRGTNLEIDVRYGDSNGERIAAIREATGRKATGGAASDEHAGHRRGPQRDGYDSGGVFDGVRSGGSRFRPKPPTSGRQRHGIYQY